MIKIEDRVYLGTGRHSKNKLLLEKYKISHIQSSAKEVEYVFGKSYAYKLVPLTEVNGYDTNSALNRAANFIKQSLEFGSGILIHDGLISDSRSTSCLIAFLIKYSGVDLDDAYKKLQEKRETIVLSEFYYRELQKFKIFLKDRYLGAQKLWPTFLSNCDTNTIYTRSFVRDAKEKTIAQSQRSDGFSVLSQNFCNGNKQQENQKKYDITDEDQIQENKEEDEKDEQGLYYQRKVARESATQYGFPDAGKQRCDFKQKEKSTKEIQNFYKTSEAFKNQDQNNQNFDNQSQQSEYKKKIYSLFFIKKNNIVISLFINGMGIKLLIVVKGLIITQAEKLMRKMNSLSG